MRKGFTLVELLVVIAVIGILIAILLPAVQSSREAARRVTCYNNLKQLALATHLFQEKYKKLPIYWSQQVKNEIEGGWLIHLLPYLEQSASYDKVAADRAMSQVRITVQEQSPDYRAPVYGTAPGAVPIWIPGTGETTQNISNHNGHTWPQNPVTDNGHWQNPPQIVITPGQGTAAVYRYEYKGVSGVGSLYLSAVQCLSDPSQAKSDVPIKNSAAYSQLFYLTNYQANYHAWVKQLKKASPMQTESNKFEDIRDGLSGTLLFAEGMRYCDGAYRMAFWNTYQAYNSHNLGVDWNAKTNTFMFQSVAHPKKCNNWRVQALHFGQLSVAMCDGSVRSVSPGISRRETSDPDNPVYGVDPTMGPETGVWDRILMPYDGGVVGAF